MRWPPVLVACLVAGGCASTVPPPPDGGSAADGADRWLLTGTRVYVSPDVPPIEDGIVIVEGASIVAVAPAASVRLSGELRRSPCSGGVITAGFHNSHVHFLGAGGQPPEVLEAQLAQMLNRYGFTTVVDTGSDVADTVALRDRIMRGELRGPRILTAGLPLYPANGLPFYMSALPPGFLAQLPQPATADEAVNAVERNFAAGADATKLFLVTPQADGTVRRMAPEIARAAAAATHARGKLVLVHPTSNEGVKAAIAAGADVLVHTVLDKEKTLWDEAFVEEMLASDIALVPTLKLWSYELAKAGLPAHIRELAAGDAVDQLRAFARAGGQVLFGTDVGYMTDFDPTDEYVLMASAGLTPGQILASLTTAPAALWRDSERRGRVEPGLEADLVVLAADPADDVKNFADVRCTFRAGQEIFRQGG